MPLNPARVCLAEGKMSMTEPQETLMRRIMIQRSIAFGAGLHAFVMLAQPQQVHAATQSPWALPESMQWFEQQGIGFRLRGQASMRWFGLLLYEARLWTNESFDAKAWADHGFGLELIYARSFEGARIAQTSLELMQAQHGKLAERDRQWLAWMLKGFPDIQAKDRLLGLHRAGKTDCRFVHNRQARLEVSDAAFARAFFGIWLDPRTTEPALRRGLIGES